MYAIRSYYALEKNRENTAKLLEEMQPNKRQIQKIVQKLKSLIKKVERAEQEALEWERRIGLPLVQIRVITSYSIHYTKLYDVLSTLTPTVVW